MYLAIRPRVIAPPFGTWLVGRHSGELVHVRRGLG